MNYVITMDTGHENSVSVLVSTIRVLSISGPTLHFSFKDAPSHNTLSVTFKSHTEAVMIYRHVLELMETKI